MIAALECLFLVRFTCKRFDHTNASKCLLHGDHHFAHSCLFTLHCLSRASAINAEGKQATGEKNQGDQSEFPIHQEENADCPHNGDRLLENIAANAGQRHLHHPRIVGNAGHQKARAHLVKKIHGMANHLAEELLANIGDDFVAHPLHAIGTSVRTEAAHGHDGRNSETDQDNRIDFRPRVQGV